MGLPMPEDSISQPPEPSPMRDAYDECSDLHRRHVAGEIGQYEYEVARDAVIEKHLGASEPVKQEWVP